MKQEQALAFLKSGRNVFLTGSAGTGKTYVLKQYIHYLKERKIPVAVTASTGIAATHMNGMTIHSWAGIGIKDKLSSANLKTLKTKKYLEKKLDKVKVLIIDEISMLHQNQLTLVDQVLKFFKMNQLPFGGVQLVLCGDFFQLPPVGNPHESSKDKFAFMSPVWVQYELTVCYLTEQYRQNNDELRNILNEIRSGRISEYRYLKLKATEHQTLDMAIEPTRLFTHNVNVDDINQQELAKLRGKSSFYTAEVKGNEKLLETLTKSVLANEQIELKAGAKVMFVRNNPEKGIVNGSLGEVVDFDEENIPLVKLLDERIVSAEPEDWKIQDESGKTLARFNQVPLRLAWAITIHKSQGMTLDAAEIDLSNTFEKGQGYVALSRLKKLESLRLLGLNETALKIEPLAFKADKRFKELSDQVASNTSDETLNKEAFSFLESCGGLTDENAIKKQKDKLLISQSEKENTYDITYSYLKQHIPLEQIAEERGMTTGTIAGHLIKIKKDYPEANLSHYKPAKSIVNKVEAVYQKTPREKVVSLKKIYEALGGKISYTDIKLSLAFIV